MTLDNNAGFSGSVRLTQHSSRIVVEQAALGKCHDAIFDTRHHRSGVFLKRWWLTILRHNRSPPPSKNPGRGHAGVPKLSLAIVAALDTTEHHSRVDKRQDVEAHRAKVMHTGRAVSRSPQ